MAGAQTPQGAGAEDRAVLADLPLRFAAEAQTQGYLSLVSSPAEQIIQQRGRKSLPIIWSPDLDLNSITSHSQQRTPTRGPALPSRTPTPTRGPAHPSRTPPRKRLCFTDCRDQIAFSPDKIDFTDLSTPKKFKSNSPVKGTPPKKRPRIDKTLESESDVPIKTALTALSPAQLITMIGDIARRHPELEREMRRDMPEPDLTPLKENLIYLKLSILKSLPKSRLSSKTGLAAYSRVSTHLAAFKRCVVSQVRALVASRQWGSVLRYAAAAWGHVRHTPVFEAAVHNASRDDCFRALATACTAAVQHGVLGRESLLDARRTLQPLAADSRHLHACLHLIHAQLKELFTNELGGPSRNVV